MARARPERWLDGLGARPSVATTHRRGGGVARPFTRARRIERGVAAQAPAATARRRANAPADAHRLDDAAATSTAPRHDGSGHELARARGGEDEKDDRRRRRIEGRARRLDARDDAVVPASLVERRESCRSSSQPAAFAFSKQPPAREREGGHVEREDPEADPARRGLTTATGRSRRGRAGARTGARTGQAGDRASCSEAAPPRGANRRRPASSRTRTSSRAARSRHV